MDINDAQPEAGLSEHPEVQKQTEEPSAVTEPRRRNDRYFLKEDPMAVFLVEDHLFRVHQYHLGRESKHFLEMFEKESDQVQDNGKTFHLPGVTIAEFESLLDYFYKSRKESGTFQDLLNLLSVSHKCQVPNASQFAKTRLDHPQNRNKIQPLQRLVLGKQYSFEDWVNAAFRKLVAREEALSVDDAMTLGFDGLADFVKAREERLENAIEEAERNRAEWEAYEIDRAERDASARSRLLLKNLRRREKPGPILRVVRTNDSN